MDSNEISDLKEQIEVSWTRLNANPLNLNELYAHVALLTSCMDNILTKIEQEEIEKEDE